MGPADVRRDDGVWEEWDSRWDGEVGNGERFIAHWKRDWCKVN